MMLFVFELVDVMVLIAIVLCTVLMLKTSGSWRSAGKPLINTAAYFAASTVIFFSFKAGVMWLAGGTVFDDIIAANYLLHIGSNVVAGGSLIGLLLMTIRWQNNKHANKYLAPNE